MKRLRIIRLEWINVLRDGWVISLTAVFLLITFFSLFNGEEKVSRRKQIIEQALAEQHSQDQRFAGRIDSLDRSLMAAPDPWLDPRRLSVYGQRAPRVVAMHPYPLSAICVGQSDLFTHVVKPSIYGEAEALGFSELANPVQLLFGTFDLSFVITYLLPLFVLAVSYNILSHEREQGSLRLTVAQPVSLLQWLVIKAMLRFAAVWVIVIGSILAGLLWVTGSIGTGIGFLIAAVTLYMLFWFVVALAINLNGRSSGENAITLIALWTFLCLIVPSMVSQTANTVYPVPSRTHLIHEYRQAEAEVEKKADEILSGYLREHPELVRADSTEKVKYAFWLQYFASFDVLRKATGPVLDAYNSSLEKQQSWVDQFKVLSPAMLVQDAMSELAGTSSYRYAQYRKEVIRFAETWRGFFIPRMFANESMTTAAISQLPTPATSAVIDFQRVNRLLLMAALFCVGVTALTFYMYRRATLATILQSE